MKNRPVSLLRLILFSFAAIGLATVPLQAGSPEQKNQEYSLEDLRSPRTTASLSREAEQMVEEWKERAKKAKKEDDDDLEDDLKDALELLEFTQDWLERASRPGASDREIFEANSYADRILQTVRDPITSEFLPQPGQMLRNFFLGPIFGVAAPRQPSAGTDQPIGKRLADRESDYLVDRGRDAFYRPEELAILSAAEIAALDISLDNALWYDRESFRHLSPNAVAHFETAMIEGMTGALREDDDLGKDETYDLHAARKVLFLEDIYLSATSPKGSAEDAFGVEWKLKWGDEVSVEPVSSRLYLLAGAKMTDLTLTNGSGPDDMILILMDPEHAEEESEEGDLDEERFPSTVEELAEAVHDFYGFTLDPYIHSQGTITEENVDSLLRHLPSGGKKKYRKSKLIGRHWVSFRESSVELKPKGFVRRHDGSRMSDLVAVHDRAARGTLIFDMWIANRDAKSGNNKAFFLKESHGGKMEIDDYREGHHDLGLSLGSLWGAGAVNKLKAGTDFLRPGLFGRQRFRQTVIFRPEAWDAATWADCRWMTENLARITDPQLEEAVAASGWPDFACEALLYKLRDRRDRIARIYGVTTSTSGRDLVPPSRSISLGSDTEIRAAERHYLLEPGSLAAELLTVDGAGPGYREPLLIDGQIAECEDSALIRLLVRQRHPSGLSSRYQRTGDKGPDCLEEP